MMLWNKVSPVFPYLDDVRSGTNDGQVGVSFVKFKGSLYIFAAEVCQSGDAVGCLLLWRLRHLLSICSAIISGFFNPLFWRWRIASLCCLGCSPQPMFFQRLLDLVSSEWCLWSSKLCVAMTFASVTFPYCLFSVFFKLQWTTNNRMNKATRELFGVILFPLCHLASSCLSIVLSIIFIDMNKIWDTFLVSS